jgi:CHASE1-domain containing sensor protein
LNLKALEPISSSKHAGQYPVFLIMLETEQYAFSTAAGEEWTALTQSKTRFMSCNLQVRARTVVLVQGPTSVFMDRMRSVDVLVAGGGLAGLAVAVGLRFRGIDAHVFGEQAGLRS